MGRVLTRAGAAAAIRDSLARWDPKGRYETVLDPAAPDISIEATLVSSPAGDPVAELESRLGHPPD